MNPRIIVGTLSVALLFTSGAFAQSAASNKAFFAKNSVGISRIATVGADVKTYTHTETADTWVYRVQAFNGVGASAYSNTATIRVR
jgi:ABC-type Fe3+-siderophore transport system permease subunit